MTLEWRQHFAKSLAICSNVKFDDNVDGPRRLKWSLEMFAGSKDWKDNPRIAQDGRMFTRDITRSIFLSLRPLFNLPVDIPLQIHFSLVSSIFLSYFYPFSALVNFFNPLVKIFSRFPRFFFQEELQNLSPDFTLWIFNYLLRFTFSRFSRFFTDFSRYI